MVSLARVRHHNVFAESGEFSVNSDMNTPSDTQNLLQPVVGERSKSYGYINTLWAAFFLLIFSAAVGAFVVVVSIIWPMEQYVDCEPYFWAFYTHSIFWCVTLIVDIYLRRKHLESRIEGYLEFYMQTVKYSRAPYYITTICNAGLLAASAVIHQMYGNLEPHCKGNPTDPLHYVAAIILLEVVLVISLLVLYMVKVRRFNMMKVRPDALRDEWMASFIRDSYSGGEVGCREGDNHIQELLEKQADLLRYLKEQNSRLVQKVMILSLQLQEKHTPSIT